MGFVGRHKVKLAALSVVFFLWLFSLPKPLFDDPTATVVESREGQMLGARIADDGQWRFPEVDSVPYRFEQCILHFEDEYFYSHPGFNPVSMAKAIWGNLTTDKRRGGSTITQQVVRLSRKNPSRTYAEKFIEIFKATRLEAGYSKKEILNLYSSHAPFGGNVVGLETASWRYFGIPSHELSWGQAASLAVLPNAPSLVFPGRNEAILKKKRDLLLLKLRDKGIIDDMAYELALLERLPGKPFPLPDLAPHLIEKVRKEHIGQRVKSTVDVSLQQQLTLVAEEHHFQLRQNEIHNLAILVLDVNTREVVGYVGNAPTSGDNDRFVDIIQSPRSTGSILKPFLYASALHSGEILPDMLIDDVPTVVNGYSPENFDRKFYGSVPAGEALSRSLNVPAVRLLRSHGLPRFRNTLEKLNLSTIDKPADHYGLSLILGGAESTLWDITNAYAAMASTLNYFNDSSSEYLNDEFVTPRFTSLKEVDRGTVQFDPEVFDAGSIYLTFEAMRRVNRPEGEVNWEYFTNSRNIAWKTGTSFGFKDAWAVGITPKYAIGIWVGNADGEGRPGLTGIQAAAPVLFDVLNLLPNSDWFDIPYDELTEAEVCSKSGHLAGVHCEETSTDWIPSKGTRTEACPYHKQVFLNSSENFRVNSSCYELGDMLAKNWFSLPPVQEYYYAAQHPEYRPLPPFDPQCLREEERTMEFVFPRRNEAIILPKDFDESVNPVVFKLAHRIPETPVYWYLGEEFIGTTETFHEITHTPKPGNYRLTVMDKNGNEISQSIEIVGGSD